MEGSLDWQSRTCTPPWRETGKGAVPGPWKSCKLPDTAEISSKQLLGVLLKEPGPTTGSPYQIQRDLCVPIQRVLCSPIPALALWPPGPCLWWWQHRAGQVDGHPWAALGVAAQPMGQDLAPGMVSGHWRRREQDGHHLEGRRQQQELRNLKEISRSLWEKLRKQRTSVGLRQPCVCPCSVPTSTKPTAPLCSIFPQVRTPAHHRPKHLQTQTRHPQTCHPSEGHP